MNSFRISLGSVDRGMAGDDFYYLSRDRDRQWQVEVMHDYEQPQKIASWSIIPESTWETVIIGGKTILELAQAAIKAI